VLIVTEFVTLDGVMEAPGGEPTHPPSIGAGLRVFPEDQLKLPWRRVDSVEFPTGVRVDTYHPAG
jgi:hypothetical protein